LQCITTVIISLAAILRWPVSIGLGILLTGNILLVNYIFIDFYHLH
jgi:hypothetical protein